MKSKKILTTLLISATVLGHMPAVVSEIAFADETGQQKVVNNEQAVTAKEYAIDLLNTNDWCSQLYTNAQGKLAIYGWNVNKMFSSLVLQKANGTRIDLNVDCSSLPKEPLVAGDQLIFVPKMNIDNYHNSQLIHFDAGKTYSYTVQPDGSAKVDINTNAIRLGFENGRYLFTENSYLFANYEDCKNNVIIKVNDRLVAPADLCYGMLKAGDKFTITFKKDCKDEPVTQRESLGNFKAGETWDFVVNNDGSVTATKSIKVQTDWKINYKDGIATITGYTGQEKDITIPNVQDLKAMDATTYANLKEVHITKMGMQAAAKVANANGGTVTVSGNGNRKVIADGVDWSFTFGSLALGYDDKITKMDLNNLDVSNIKDMHEMFHFCSNLQQLAIDDWNVSNVTDMSHLFCGCHNLQTLDLNNWNVMQVKNMAGLFSECWSLQSINIKNWRTNNVTNMAAMFCACKNLAMLNINNWNVSNVTDMDDMFDSCAKLQTLDLNNWNVAQVQNMNTLFRNCKNLQTLKINNWNVSNVTAMSAMFARCDSLKELDIRNWNVSNVTDMTEMFSLDNNLQTLILSNWKLKDNVQMYHMFYYVSAFGTGSFTIYTSDPLIKKYSFDKDLRQHVHIFS